VPSMQDIWDSPDEIYFREFQHVIKPPPTFWDSRIVTVDELSEKTETLYTDIMTRFEELINTKQIEQPDPNSTPALYLGRRVDELQD
jgi:hypothetical protein